MEDEWIDAENIYQLWIAEGMVLSSDKKEGETMMQVAESYMGELVHRSMAQVRVDNLEPSSSKFRSCSLHDLMRDLSLSKAKKEDFLDHDNSYGVSLIANARQLVVYDKGGLNGNSYFITKPNHQQYRSILLLNVDDYGSPPPRLGSYFANFKLLRVLALENIKEYRRQSVLGSLFGTYIERVLSSLVYLRYLSLRGSLETFSWVQKLVLLQTLKLDIHNFTYMPPVSRDVLVKLGHLRHLCLPYSQDWKDYDNLGENFKLRFNGMSKLETLENFNTSWCEVKDLPILSSLRRLKLKAVGGYDDVKEMFKYLSDMALSSNSCLQYLTLSIMMSYPDSSNPDMIRQLFWNHKLNLRELEIDGCLPELAEIFEEQKQLYHTHIDASFTGITKLQLSFSNLDEDPMQVLEKIPTLRDLKLAHNAYRGKEMVCSAMGFPKLSHLEFYCLYKLEKWRVDAGSMPIIQHLKIRNCRELEELPKGLIFLKSLRELELIDMAYGLYCRTLEQGPDFYKIAHVPRITRQT